MGSRRSRCSRRERTSTTTIPRRSPICSSGWPEAGLTLHGVHAPVDDRVPGRPVGRAIESGEHRRRPRAHARSPRPSARCTSRGGFRSRCVVMHLGPAADGDARRPSDSRAAARRSIEELHGIAEPLGVQIAVEVIPNELSRAGSLVHFVEEELDGLDGRPVGICLDFGHAHIDGDLVDAIETVSEHLVTAARARQPRPDRRPSGAVRGDDRLAGGADRGAEGRLRRAADLRDRRPRIDEGHAGARAQKARQRMETTARPS